MDEGTCISWSVAAAFAMSFRLMGLSHWIMYEMASLFENIGTVRDGSNPSKVFQ